MRYLLLCFVSIFCFSLNAQVVYSLSGPCSEQNIPEASQLNGVLGNQLIYQYDVPNFNRLFRSGLDPVGAPDTLLNSSRTINRLYLSDSVHVYTTNNRLYALYPGQEAIQELSIGQTYQQATVWRGDIYYVIDGPGSPDQLFRYSVDIQESTLLYTSDFGGIRGIGTLDDYVVIISNGETNKELVRTDGTVEGTEAFFSLYPAGSEFWPSRNTRMTSDGEKLYFFYTAGTEDENVLFVTDGTTDGSARLKGYGRLGSFSNIPAPIMDDNGMLYFITRELGAPTGQTYEIHRSDGTIDGTFNLNDNAGNSYFNPQSMSLLRGTLYFDVSGSLYQSDGTIAGTEKLLGGVPEGGPRFASRVATFNDSLLITGSATFSDGELYISDGTPAGTRLLADLNEGGDGTSSFPNEYVVGDSIAYFKTTSSSFFRQLFAYDLTRQELPAPPVSLTGVAVGNETSFGPGSIEISAEGRGLAFSLGDSTNTNGVFSGLLAGMYTFTVQDTFGCQVTDSTEVQLALSNGSFSGSDEVIVYPNPASIGGEIQLRFLTEQDRPHSLSLYAVNGQLVTTYRTNEPALRLPSKAGAYLLVGRDESGRGMFRRIVLVE